MPGAASSNGTVRRCAAATVTGTAAGAVWSSLSHPEMASEVRAWRSRARANAGIIGCGSRIVGSGRRIASETERTSAPWIEDAGVVRQLRERHAPCQPSVHLLGPRRRERALCGEEVEDAADARLVARERHGIGLLGAADQHVGSADPTSRRLQPVVGAEHLEDHLLPQCFRAGLSGLRLEPGATQIVLPRKAVEDRNG